jgi:hypothetical protein
MDDETTGVPVRHELPPMRATDWIYGFGAIAAAIAAWWAVFWLLGQAFRVASRVLA